MSHSSDLIAQDIQAYLQQHQHKQLLRFLTCGSVDDGKSTLIGRLLYDAKLIYDDQLAALKRDSKKFNTTEDEMDLALLMDGLQAEREQGITIDVAYRYFSTDKRKFIIADTPGHEQYTRNMVTGASNCDLAIILIDARNGIKEQTRRHSFIVSLLGIKQIVVAINKMDLVDYSQEIFNKIRKSYLELIAALPQMTVKFIPISARRGDNIVNKSPSISWYRGPTLLKWLECVDINNEGHETSFRMPVQYVNRASSDFRGYSGNVTSGKISCGDEILILPSEKKAHIKSIVTYDGELANAEKGQAITLTLTEEIDICRGDMLADPINPPHLSEAVDVMLVWMVEAPLQPRKQYEFKFATKTVFGHVDAINYQVDIHSLEHIHVLHLNLNAIARCQVKLSQRIAFDIYNECRGTGSFIMIDRITNATVGAGMIVASIQNKTREQFSSFELELNALIRKHFPHWDVKDLQELLTTFKE